MNVNNFVCVKYYNQIFLEIETLSSEVLKKIENNYSFQISKYRVKNYSGSKNPTICLLRYGRLLYKGLLNNLLMFLDENDIEYWIDDKLLQKESIDEQKFDQFVEKLNLTKTPYHFQRKIVLESLRWKNRLIMSPTSSGKSLSIFLVCLSYLALRKDKTKKVIIIVPSLTLVNQMYYDFKDYARNNDKIDIDNIFQRLSSEESVKVFSKDVLITTWQSLTENIKNPEFCSQFEMLLYDEVHSAQAPVARKICESIHSSYRIGFTGTLDDEDLLSNYTLEGLFGNITPIVKTRELMDLGLICRSKIRGVVFNHGTLSGRLEYDKEVEMLRNIPERIDRMVNIISKASGNSMVLFRSISYGKEIASKLAEKTRKKIFFIDGSVKGKDRESIRNYIDKNENCIGVFSYATCGTGFSIKNIHNVFFTESMKSKIRVIQAVGRGLRLHDSKSIANIIDFADLITYEDDNGRISANYTYSHYNKRKKHYQQEEHDFADVMIKMSYYQ